MSAPSVVAGWKHREDDDRDWTIETVLTAPHLLTTSNSPVHDALKAVLRSTLTPKSVKAWAKLVTEKVETVLPPPPPPPPPPPVTPTATLWKTTAVLDQGNTPHCVGFTGADFLGDDPVMQAVSNGLGHTIYYECKVFDGEPNAENGSDMRSLGKALKQRARIDGYAFAQSMDDVVTWLTTKGPVMVGTEWFDGMFEPDVNGFVKPTGKSAGGHAWSLIGYDPSTKVFTAQNHWGTDWGLGGLFKINFTDLEPLLAGNGEALVAVELPL